MTISIIVPTWNRAALLRGALETLVRQETQGRFSFEVLVVDDGSVDDTFGVVQEISRNWGPVVRYVYKEHGGVGSARNTGVQEARGEWLAFCDDDQLADSRWLVELFTVARRNNARCVDGSVYLKLLTANSPEFGPMARSFLGEKILGATPGGYSSKNLAGTGNVLIHKSLFEIAGGFDSTLQQGEDTDFFWRVEELGFKIYHAPQAIVHHVIPGSKLHVAYLRETCRRIGKACARIQGKHQGSLVLLLAMIKRAGAALLRDFPLILIATAARNNTLLLDKQCALWYSLGFLRGGLSLKSHRSNFQFAL